MIVWIDRNVYMERPWALEGAQGRLFIDEVQLREGFERTINSIRARGGWDVYLSEFELEMREESEKGLWLTANWHSGARRLVRRRARGRHPGGAEVPGVPDGLARLLAEEKEEGVEGASARPGKVGVTSMKRLGSFLMAALKVTLGFFVWLFRAVFKWVM